MCRGQLHGGGAQGVGLRATRPDELDAKIMEMISIDRPVIFDCVVDKTENCFPMIPSGAAHDEMILGDTDDQPGVTEAGRQMV